MSRKKLFLFPCFLLLAMGNASAQYNEVGFMAGMSNYKGELSPHLFNTDFLHFAGGGFFRHNWNRHWSYKVELNYGRISGDDAMAKTGFAHNRNLSFYSDILEFSPQVEFNFFPYETGNPDFSFTPYLFTGLAVFHFNPKAELNGKVYELQPLTTEGEEPYNLVVFALPIGGGLKVSLGNVGFGIEVGARRTYTDYLDDVSTTYPDFFRLLAARGPVAVALSDRSLFLSDTSVVIPNHTGKQRGNSKDSDWYVFAGVTLYVRINSATRDSCSPFKRRRY
ncbi:MAG: DUF6089 family protein [Bacteroidetes bacterium]|nr:DUF6089 family protein [Bacteroidota bacterium]